MSRVTNIVILSNTWLDENEVDDILNKLKPLENQELNPGKNAFKHIDNYSIGCSRHLERTIFLGAVHNMDDDMFKGIVKNLIDRYDIQILIDDENDVRWMEIHKD